MEEHEDINRKLEKYQRHSMGDNIQDVQYPLRRQIFKQKVLNEVFPKKIKTSNHTS
jgi:hypothetical protein